MLNLPLISVIVPVYKVEKYLDQCVRSITGQTYENLEILLVDDGSPDGSGAICDTWAEKDSRVKVIHKENGGSGKARNVALDLAKGDLIAFVDSDDYISIDMFAHLYSLLERGADIAECSYLETADDGVNFPKMEATVTGYDAEMAMREHIQDRRFRQLIWNKLYRREMIGEIRFPEDMKIDDEFFTYRVLGNAGKLLCSDKICYAYRQQPESIMHQPFSLKRVQGLWAKQQRLGFLKECFPGLVSEAKVELALSCMYAMQGSLKSLKGDQLAEAKALIRKVWEDALPIPEEGLSGKKKLLLKLAQKDLEKTSRLLNFLIDIHVLT